MQRRAGLLAVVTAAATFAACDRSKKPSPAPPASASSAPSAFAPEKAPLPAPPRGLPRMAVPPGNPLTTLKAALGRQLFFDKRLSANGKLACDSCHSPKRGTGGGDRVPIGPAGKPLGRHAPALWNAGYARRLHWDGRSGSVEEAVRLELTGPSMGLGEEGLRKKAAALARIPGYRSQLDRVFPARGAKPDALVKALATFLRTLTCGDTAFDRFNTGDPTALASQQKKGWDLFKRAGCPECHAPPFFSDAYSPKGGFHNAGIGTDDRSEREADPGRRGVTRSEDDQGAFRTPSLRDVARSSPYFHDGSTATLGGAVILMARGGRPNPHLSEKLSDRHLKPHELQSIIDFLSSLTCGEPPRRPKLPPDPG